MITDSPHTSQRASASSSRATSRAPSITNIERTDTTDAALTAGTSTTDIDAKTTVSLDTKVSAGGTNFSQGQWQLIAMARALLVDGI